MSSKKKEQVLVTANTADIHYSTGDYFHMLIDGSDGWKDEVIKGSAFIDRWMAELDSTVLQLIPYVACVTKGGKVLSYQRKGGGEGRLEGKYSIGIGGHVNTTDLPTGPDRKPTWDTVFEGAVREVVEELEISEQHVRDNLREVGTVYIPSDDGGDHVGPGPNVGEVHIGIVYVLLVDEDVTIKDDEGMINPEFVDINVATAQYETWSQKTLGSLEAILEHVQP